LLFLSIIVAVLSLPLDVKSKPLS